MPLPKKNYIERLMSVPRDSLLVGTLATNGQEGVESKNTVVEGTPSGFRALAGVLLKMADTVESGEAEAGKGWGLLLHPDDIPALHTFDVEALSLCCQPQLDLSSLDSPD